MTHVSTRPLTDAERAELLEIASPEDSALPGGRPIGRWLLIWSAVLILSIAGCAALVRFEPHPLVFGTAGGLLFVLGLIAVFAICALVGSGRFQTFGAPRLQRETAHGAQEVLARNEARVLRVESTAVIEVEAFEDEGAGYFFQVQPEKVLFLQGQYLDALQEDPSWPSSAFEIAAAPPLNWQRITILGERLEPMARIRPEELNPEAQWPEDGDELEGTIETVMARFRRPW